MLPTPPTKLKVTGKSMVKETLPVVKGTFPKSSSIDSVIAISLSETAPPPMHALEEGIADVTVT